MCQRHIREINIIRCKVETQILLAHLARNEIEMREHCLFGLSSRSRGSSQNQNGVIMWLLFHDVKGLQPLVHQVAEGIYLKPHHGGQS